MKQHTGKTRHREIIQPTSQEERLRRSIDEMCAENVFGDVLVLPTIPQERNNDE